MPRDLPVEYQYKISSTEQIETHSVMMITLLGDAVLEKVYYYASANLTIDGVKFVGSIKTTANIQNSIAQSVDRIELELQNVDSIAGLNLLKAREQLFGAEVKFGWYRRSADSGVSSLRWFFQGVAAGCFVNQDVAKVLLISDAYAAISVGASRKVARDCQSLYKDPTACAYTGNEPTCDFTFNSLDGCAGRWKAERFAHYYGMAFIEEDGTVTSSMNLVSVSSNQLLRNEIQEFRQQPFVQITGSVSRNDNIARKTTIETVNSGYLNVKSFGATGDGVTNDRAAVNAAILEASLGDHKVIYFPPGVYNVTGTGVSTGCIEPFGRMILQGAGKAATVIYSTSNDPIVHVKRNALFQGPDIRNLTIRGTVLSGDAQHGLMVDDSPFLYTSIFEDIRIEDCGGHGVYHLRGFSTTYRNVYMHNCAKDPFVYDAANMPGNAFHSLYVEDIRSTGIQAFRIKSGYFCAHNLNGVNSIQANSAWMVIGKKAGVDGDLVNSGTSVCLYDCNIESSNLYGIKLYHLSVVKFYGDNFFALNTGAGSQTPRYAIHHELNQNGIDFFAEFVPRGFMDDGVNFANGVGAYHLSQPIHCNGFFPFEIDGVGPAGGGGDPINSYYDYSTSTVERLSRRGGRVNKRVISATATFNRPGCGYYEVDTTSGPVTLTLEWSGWHQNVQQIIIIKDKEGTAGTNPITVIAGAGGTIGDESSYVINVNYGAVALMPEGFNLGDNYRIISSWPDVPRLVARLVSALPWDINDWNGTGQPIPFSMRAPLDNGGTGGLRPMQPVLALVVDGRPFETYASAAEFHVGRYVLSASNSRTEMMIALLHGGAEVAGTPVVRFRSDKSSSFEGEYGGPQIEVNATGTVNLDWGSTNQHYVLLQGNTTLTFSGGKEGRRYILLTQQDGTGGRILTWPTIKWPGGVAGVVTSGANAYDIWVFYCDGTNYHNISKTQNLS